MIDRLSHRGPDDRGVWSEVCAGGAARVGFGHRRLSILDLSAEGHQPMVSAGSRYVITYNGEVYNFRELREELQAAGVPFRGHSDTEVIVNAMETWGIETAVRRFIGMFAFALWDREERRLWMVRDRLGIKPVYYGTVGKAFVFGSELKAIRAFPGFNASVDRGSLSLFLRHSYVPAPYSIYEGIGKLQPGHLLSVRVDGNPGATPEISPYWSAKEVARKGIDQPFQGSDSDATSRLEELLSDAVRLRKVSDVPLGAFLSGGIDSSMVVALMQAQSDRPTRTFSIGFHESSFNEAEQARAVADHLGTDHTELYVTPEDCMGVIPELPQLYDEPFSDASQVPTYLVSKLARQHVTVSLSGDGGDELFAGYNRYNWGRRVWRSVAWMPKPARRGAARALTAVSPESWARLFQFLPRKLRQRNPGDKLHKLADVLTCDSAAKFYTDLVSHWKAPADVVVDGREPATLLSGAASDGALPGLVQQMLYLDTVTYLPDDILVKVDRASMGVRLEARVPLLDHRVVEFAWSLPFSMKMRGGVGKWLLRQVLHRHVPRSLVERPKMGFGIPIAAWLRGPLRDWAEDLLDPTRLSQEGYLRPEPVLEKWREHLSGQRNWGYYLWDVLMFQAWLAGR